MYYYIISALKRRLILELQDSFSQHPVYSKLVPFIQNKYAFTERPHFGIVCKGSSANKVVLSGDNFVGTIESHVMLAQIGEPVYPLEWVREDLAAVRANGNVFPLRPGVYYLEILTTPTNEGESGTFAVDPLYTVTNEPVFKFQTGTETEAQLQSIPSEGTVRLWDNNRVLLREGTDYTVDYATGAVKFYYQHAPGATVVADYRVAGGSLGPVEFKWNQADFNTLPGVVLAFGKRAKVGDKVAVVVYQDRISTANAYGGKNEVSFDLDCIATDPMQMEEIADLVVMYLWGIKKPNLELEGIEIIDISIGGESEESFDEQAEIFFYTASISIQLRADWEIHVPLPLTISRVTATSTAGDTAAPPGEAGPSTISLVYGNLYFATAPVAVGRNYAFERIG
jgi:hypothetical protein